MMLAFAVLRFGLRPQDFWALSAGEWRALMEAVSPQGEAMNRETLTALVKQYGDGNA